MEFSVLAVSLNRAHLLEIDIINLETKDFEIKTLSFINANFNPTKLLYLARDFFDFVMMNDLTINTENIEIRRDFLDRITDIDNINDFIDISFINESNENDLVTLYLDEPDDINLLARILW